MTGMPAPTAACAPKSVRWMPLIWRSRPQERELAVGAVVLAVGNDVFDPSRMKQYLYGQHPNVVTSIEYERLYSGTGPYGGHLVRPSDESGPKKIAWLQCIGSRDLHSHSYCSSVCCMYAIKEAMIAKDYLPGVDTAIFYMDMRVVGKNYEQYLNRARDEYGVRFICYRVPEIAPAENGDLKITYFDAEGRKQVEIFNLVVLSSGFEVSARSRELAGRLGIELDRHNYPRTDPFVPVASSRPGVYVCGTFQAPKDIPESITEASAAAACCQAWLGGARQIEAKVEEKTKIERGRRASPGHLFLRLGTGSGRSGGSDRGEELCRRLAEGSHECGTAAALLAGGVGAVGSVRGGAADQPGGGGGQHALDGRARAAGGLCQSRIQQVPGGGCQHPE